MMDHYITLRESNSGDHSGVHFRPDARTPKTSCGLDFTGVYATTHPIVSGEAFTCLECRSAWLDKVSSLD